MSAPIGQLTERVDILDISNSFPCLVTTDGLHGFPNKSFVRLTGLNGAMPIARGEDELNNKKFRIFVTSEDTFLLQDPITFKYIDSSNFPPYVEGGSCNLVQQTYIYYPSVNQEYPN
jgi:hypothetical protein